MYGFSTVNAEDSCPMPVVGTTLLNYHAHHGLSTGGGGDKILSLLKSYISSLNFDVVLLSPVSQ